LHEIGSHGEDLNVTVQQIGPKLLEDVGVPTRKRLWLQ
jgi:hypothetical protein